MIKSAQKCYGQQLPIHLVLGGLAPGTADALDDAGKRSISEHWNHVCELAGQSFDFSFFERDNFVYDTEPACRAVVAGRRLRSDAAIDFLIHIHKEFYTRNRDITDSETLCELAGEFGFDIPNFKREFDAEETARETQSDFNTSRQIGIRGYPALLAGGKQKGYTVITSGYQSWEQIEVLITDWIEGTEKESTD